MIDIERIKTDAKILELAKYLGLELRGNQARCFNSGQHKNNDQHFSLGLDVKTNHFKCFGCDVSGSVIDLFMQVRGVEFKDAIKELADWAGIMPLADTYKPKTSPYKPKAGIYVNKLLNTPQVAKNNATGDDIAVYEALESHCEGLDQESIKYLTGESRRLSEEIIKQFRLFNIKDYQATSEYLKKEFTDEQLKSAGVVGEKGTLIFYKHKIVIPFIEDGRVIFLQGRRTDDEQPKYMHISKTVPLFNIDVLKDLKQNDKIYICEGVFDTIMLSQKGFKAVGILGVNNFKAEMIELFDGLNVVLAFDNDEAGQRATQSVAKMFLFSGQQVRQKELPEGCKDITDYFLTGKNTATQSPTS